MSESSDDMTAWTVVEGKDGESPKCVVKMSPSPSPPSPPPLPANKTLRSSPKLDGAPVFHPGELRRRVNAGKDDVPTPRLLFDVNRKGDYNSAQFAFKTQFGMVQRRHPIKDEGQVFVPAKPVGSAVPEPIALDDPANGLAPIQVEPAPQVPPPMTPAKYAEVMKAYQAGEARKQDPAVPLKKLLDNHRVPAQYQYQYQPEEESWVDWICPCIKGINLRALVGLA